MPDSREDYRIASPAREISSAKAKLIKRAHALKMDGASDDEIVAALEIEPERAKVILRVGVTEVWQQ